MQHTQPPSSTAPARIALLDVLRGGALVAMAIYHFAWDLEFFGYTEPGTTAVGGWRIFARSIASTFLVLVGVGLYLAHRNGVRWPPYWRRMAMIVGAAAVISVATYIATPDMFIFFGILHQIAFASLVGLLFLRLPPLVTAGIAIGVIALPVFWTSSLFDSPFLWWTGLAESRPRSSDFVPAFPWFGAVLLGIAAAGLADRAGVFARLAPVRPGAWSRPLSFAGRHSLAFYLIHQPVIIVVIWVASQIFPAPLATPQARFTASCERSCAQDRDAAFCTAYCGCMLGAIEERGLLDSAFEPGADEIYGATVREMARQCTAQTETIDTGEAQ